MLMRTLTITITLALLLQGGGVMQAAHWLQAERAAVAAECDAHHDHDSDHAPSRHHQHDHCAVCLVLAGIRPVSLSLPTLNFVETACGRVIVEAHETPCFEVFSRHSGRGPPTHL